MEISRKRSRGNSASNGNVTSTKKIRRTPCDDIILTNKQQSVINLAADTFQISPTGLLDAINDLKKSSRLWAPKSLDFKPQSSHYELGNSTFGSTQMLHPPHLSEPSLPEYDLNLLQPQSRQNEAADASNPGSANARSDAVFGFQFSNAGLWADCFANMLPSDQQLPQVPNGATQDPFAEKPLGSFQVHGQDVSNMQQTNIDWCSPFFACDNFESQWLPTSSNSFFPPFTTLQTIQPSAFRPGMVLPQDDFRMNGRPGTDLMRWDTREKEDRSWLPTDKEYGLISTESGAGEQHKSNSPNSIGKDGKLRRGTFKNLRDREETAETRLLTACIRCRMQRIRCVANPADKHGVCLTCMNVTKSKVSKLPCLRYKISDVRLFVSSMAPGRVWSTRWQDTRLKNIENWASPELRTVMMTQDFSPRPMTIQVRRFVPLESDMLDRSWAHGGVKKSVTLPPYAFANMRAALQICGDYINQEGSEHFNNILDRDDKLLRLTYSTAIKASNGAMAESERKLLKMVFRLWVSSRMTTKSIRLCGDDTLDMPHNLLDESHPMHGQIPITPVMGAQIDVIMAHGIMIPLRNLILEQLSSLILVNKPRNWFCIYLCIFILLHDCSLKMARNAIYARKHGMRTQFANMDDISEIHMGANILLAYFHYYCKGKHVFEEGWRVEETRLMAELDKEQVQLIQMTATYVKANKSHFLKVLEQKLVEHPHYFIAQLYEEDWKPRSNIL